MEQTEFCASGPAVNIPELLDRVDNDHELVCELFEMFKVESPHFLRSLREAVTRGDMKLVQSASHALKGMLGNLAITYAAGTAARIENMARDGEAVSIPEAVSLLEREVAGAVPELDSYVAETRR